MQKKLTITLALAAVGCIAWLGITSKASTNSETNVIKWTTLTNDFYKPFLTIPNLLNCLSGGHG